MTQPQAAAGAAGTSVEQRIADLVEQFRERPVEYVDLSWLPRGWPEPLAGLAALSSRSQRKLSEWLVREYELPREWTCSFSQPTERIALLDRLSLQRVALYCGSWLHRHAIRAQIGGHDVRRIKQAIGEDGYRFALASAGEDSVDGSGGSSGEALSLERLRIDGVMVLLKVLDPAGQAVLRRLRLKFVRSDLQSAECELDRWDIVQPAVARVLSKFVPAACEPWAWLF